MSDTDNQLDTNTELEEETLEQPELEQEVAEDATEVSLRDELAKQFAEAEEDTEEDEEEEDDEEEEVKDATQDAPEGINEDLKATFKYLKKEQREAIIASGQDSDNLNMFLQQVKEQNTAYHEKTKDFSDLTKVIEPYEDALKIEGTTPAQKISQYIAIDRSIQASPLEGILQLAKSYGVDLHEELSARQQREEQEIDPAMREVSSLRKELDDIKNASSNERSDVARTEISSFASARGEDGQLSYPHFELVKAKMGELFQSGEVSELKEAYDKVTKEFGLAAKSSVGTKSPKARKSVKQAKKLSQGVRSSSSASKVTTSADMSIRDELKIRLNAG